MKQKIKFIDFQNEYSQHYLKLSQLRKYNCYHLLFLKLSEILKNQYQSKNILFVHKQPNDIDYLTVLNEKNLGCNFYMTGVNFNFFQRTYYFEKINNLYNNYEFMSFGYQPKFNKEKWESSNPKFNIIDLIILPSKIVDVSTQTSYLSDKKLVDFLKNFTNAKILGIGYDFSLTNKNTRKIKKWGIKIDDFISIKCNDPIIEEREEK